MFALFLIFNSIVCWEVTVSQTFEFWRFGGAIVDPAVAFHVNTCFTLCCFTSNLYHLLQYRCVINVCTVQYTVSVCMYCTCTYYVLYMYNPCCVITVLTSFLIHCYYTVGHWFFGDRQLYVPFFFWLVVPATLRTVQYTHCT